MKLKSIFIDAAQTLYQNRIVLIKVLIIPIILISLLEIINAYSTKSYVTKFGIYIDILRFFRLLIEIVLYGLIAITTHRVILLGPDTISFVGMYKPTSREISFFIHGIILTILFVPYPLLPVFIPNILLPIAIPIFFLTYLYIICRWSLVFPAIAIESGWDFSDSWRATRNHKMTMVVVVIIFPAILGAISSLVDIIVNPIITDVVRSTFGTVMIVAVLSSAYKHILETETVK